LAIIEAVMMQKKGSIHSIVTQVLRDQKSDISVCAQVVQLVETSSCWAWTPHQFLMVSKPKKHSSKCTIHNFSMTCPGWLCFPVNPNIRPVSNMFLENELASIPTSSEDNTWVLTADELGILVEQIWEDLKSDGAHDVGATVETLLLVENLDALLYKDKKGLLFSFSSEYALNFLVTLGVAYFVVDGVRAMMNMLATDQNSHINCLLCGSSILFTQMHTHAGQHIMCSLYGMNESSLKQKVRDVQIYCHPFC
jgi:hypothetical protein